MSKEEQRKNIIAYPSLQRSVDEGLESSFFSKGSWPKEAWWEVFNTPQLSRLIQEALAGNPTLESVKKRVDFAKESSVIKRSKLFPLIYFNVEDTWTHLSKDGLYRAFNPDLALNPNLIDLGLSYTYEFDFWNKNRNLFRAALGKEKAEEAEKAQVELLITTALAQSYFALKTNLLKKKLYEELLSVRTNLLELIDLLNHNALVSKLSPLLADENREEVKKKLDGIEEEIAADKHVINSLLGKGPDAPLEIDGSLPPLPDTLVLPETLHLDLLSRRPDLMAQIWRVEALAHEVGAAKADFFPNINLLALTGFESTLIGSLLKGESATVQASPALSLPIFTAGAIRANVRAKKALFDQAVFDYNALILQSAKEIADLIALGKSVFSQKLSQERIVKSAEERFLLTQMRQTSGLDNTLERDHYQEEVILKQLDEVALVYDQYLVTIKLIKALGGGYNSAYTVPLKTGEAP